MYGPWGSRFNRKHWYLTTLICNCSNILWIKIFIVIAPSGFRVNKNYRECGAKLRNKWALVERTYDTANATTSGLLTD